MRAPGKVCASKAFWEEEAQWSERTGGFSNRNKKADASDTGLAKKEGPKKICVGKAFWGEEEQRNERTSDF